ncbi:hypothetical protein J2128_002389 [Methanomicrobium sp. W14]|uniref:hypothetical protein n=1 Tax=Methanomicrobium sp. W14 TaxID=2817839 RepID=UPI001AE5DE17|nr:hypothetical protein [Methanomicrobium sp. W14]MBP2134423.1 hypothetical protein [Methanomicrobium sp. W14]
MSTFTFSILKSSDSGASINTFGSSFIPFWPAPFSLFGDVTDTLTASSVSMFTYVAAKDTGILKIRIR